MEAVVDIALYKAFFPRFQKYLAEQVHSRWNLMSVHINDCIRSFRGFLLSDTLCTGLG